MVDWETIIEAVGNVTDLRSDHLQSIEVEGTSLESSLTPMRCVHEDVGAKEEPWQGGPEGCRGLYRSDLKAIFIAPNLSPDAEVHARAHELGHHLTMDLTTQKGAIYMSGEFLGECVAWRFGRELGADWTIPSAHYMRGFGTPQFFALFLSKRGDLIEERAEKLWRAFLNRRNLK